MNVLLDIFNLCVQYVLMLILWYSQVTVIHDLSYEDKVIKKANTVLLMHVSVDWANGHKYQSNIFDQLTIKAYQ